METARLPKLTRPSSDHGRWRMAGLEARPSFGRRWRPFRFRERNPEIPGGVELRSGVRVHPLDPWRIAVRRFLVLSAIMVLVACSSDLPTEPTQRPGAMQRVLPPPPAPPTPLFATF